MRDCKSSISGEGLKGIEMVRNWKASVRSGEGLYMSGWDIVRDCKGVVIW